MVQEAKPIVDKKPQQNIQKQQEQKKPQQSAQKL